MQAKAHKSIIAYDRIGWEIRIALATREQLTTQQLAEIIHRHSDYLESALGSTSLPLTAGLITELLPVIRDNSSAEQEPEVKRLEQLWGQAKDELPILMKRSNYTLTPEERRRSVATLWQSNDPRHMVRALNLALEMSYPQIFSTARDRNGKYFPTMVGDTLQRMRNVGKLGEVYADAIRHLATVAEKKIPGWFVPRKEAFFKAWNIPMEMPAPAEPSEQSSQSAVREKLKADLCARCRRYTDMTGKALGASTLSVAMREDSGISFSALKGVLAGEVVPPREVAEVLDSIFESAPLRFRQEFPVSLVGQYPEIFGAGGRKDKAKEKPRDPRFRNVRDAVLTR